MRKRKLTVAICGAKTYPPRIGGIETHVYNLSRELSKADFDIKIFVGKVNGDKSYEHISNIEIFRVFQSRNRYLLKLSMVLPTLFKIKNHKKEIDLYHAHDTVFGFFLLLLGYHPLVYTAHGCPFLRTDWPRPVAWALRKMEKYIYEKSDKIIAVDFKTKEVIEKYSPNKTVVIPNGIDQSQFYNKPRPKEYPDSKVIIFGVGRQIPSKGFQDLIAAFKKLPPETKKMACLIIAGDGPMLPTLRKMASGDDDIRVLGYVQDVTPYFSHADIFVLSSYYEGFPFTLIEAMAAKTACVSTDVGDISMRFEDRKEIYMIPPKNEEAITRALRELIENETLRRQLANNAYSKVIKDYSWRRITGEVAQVYANLLNRKK